MWRKGALVEWGFAMSQIKTVLIVSGITAVVFWGFSAAAMNVDWLQAEGRPAFVVAVAIASHVTFVLCWLELRREKHDRDKTLLIRTLAGGAAEGAAVPVQAPALRAVSSR
jgi:hypothetical protein